MKKWLFNPFVYVAGVKALAIGWAVMLLTACICVYSHTHFDGVIDAHNGRITPSIVYFIEPLADWCCLVFTLYASGLIFSKSAIRFIDVAGTTALARWPLLFYSIIGFGLNPPKSLHTSSSAHLNVADINTILSNITGTMIVLALIGLVFVVWMVALLYNAFSVSCNTKGGKAAGAFIGALIIAEVLSKIIFYYLYKPLI